MTILSGTRCRHLFFQKTNLDICIQYPVSSIKYSVCSIKYSVSSIQYPVSNIQCPISSIQYPVSSIQYLIFSIQYPVSSIHYPLSSIQYPVHPVKGPGHLKIPVMPLFINGYITLVCRLSYTSTVFLLYYLICYLPLLATDFFDIRDYKNIVGIRV